MIAATLLHFIDGATNLLSLRNSAEEISENSEHYDRSRVHSYIVPLCGECLWRQGMTALQRAEVEHPHSEMELLLKSGRDP